MLRKIIPILLIFSTTANATVTIVTDAAIALPEKVVNINKGDVAPFSGTLLPPYKANEIKEQLIEYDNLKLINESYKRSIELYKDNETQFNTKIKLISEQNDSLAKNLNDARTVSEWSRFGYFMLGVLGTSIAVYGVKKASQ